MLDQCVFPELDEPFATALRDSVAYAIERYEPLGIIAAGSVMRGAGHANSDIDLYVLFESEYRQLVHKYFNGVPCQIFCNPPQRMQRYFVEERGRLNGGPSTGHMLANGFVVLNRDPRIDAIRQQARDVLLLPPNPNPEEVQRVRYFAVDNLENVIDLRDSDPDMAMLIMGNALSHMLHYYFLKRGQYIPRHKDSLKHIREDNPELAQLIHRLFAATDATRYDILLEIADQTIETRTFFNYEWSPEKV